MKTQIKLLLLSVITIFLFGCGEASIVDPSGLINPNTTGTIAGAPDSVSVTIPRATMGLGTTQPGSVTGTFSDGSMTSITAGLTWTTSDASVATVDNNGVITGVGPGTAVITGIVDGVGNTVDVEVLGVNSLSASLPNTTLTVGSTQAISLAATYTDASTAFITNAASYTSSDPSVVTVSPIGVITAVGPGNATITATIGGVSTVIPITIPANTNTNPPVLTNIVVSPSTAGVVVGATQQFNATGLNSDGSSSPLSNASWSVSDINIASIDDTGLFTALAPGVVTITVVESGITGTASVTVTAASSGAVPGLRFSEIGSGNTGTGFWVELFNDTAAAVDLSDYGIKGRSVDSLGEITNPTFQLPSKSVAPGGYVVLMTDDIAGFTDVLAYAGNPNVEILTGATFSWLASGYLELLEAGVTADFVRFGSNTQAPVTPSAWTGGAAGSFSTLNYGESLARDANNTDTDSPADWTSNSYTSLGGPNDITCTIDADNDGIPDCSEVPGSTYAGMDLYAMGARTNQIDLFVEIDHMDPAGRPGESTLGMVPQRESLDKVVAAFLLQNIHVHFDVGDLFDQNPGIDPLDYDLGGGGVVPFAEEIEVTEFNGNVSTPGVVDLLDYKAQYVDLNRRSIFYYMLLAYAQFPFDPAAPQGSSGISELLGNDSMVSMGSWGFDRSTPAKTNELISGQASTLMHEFGHALGLHHGGGISDGENFKTNYLSVMNYLYTLDGLPTLGAGNDGDRYYQFGLFTNGPCFIASRTDLINGPFDDYNNFIMDFSDGSSMDLDEVNGLNEAIGFGRPNSGPIDWNCDGDTDDIVQNWDVNNGIRDVVQDHDDWSNIQYFFSVNNANRVANGPTGDGTTQRLDVMVGRDWQEHNGFVKEPTYNEVLEARSRAFRPKN